MGAAIPMIPRESTLLSGACKHPSLEDRPLARHGEDACTPRSPDGCPGSWLLKGYQGEEEGEKSLIFMHFHEVFLGHQHAMWSKQHNGKVSHHPLFTEQRPQQSPQRGSLLLPRSTSFSRFSVSSPPDIHAVAYRVRLSGLSIGSLFPVGFHHVQPWSSPVPSGRLSFVVSCSLRRSPLLSSHDLHSMR
jgi:hypothetical protein